MLTGKKRITTDKFYTNKNIVEICFESFKHYIDGDALLIEPSAGNGVFFNVLKHYPHIAFDIEPEHHDIIKQDFLKLSLESFNQPLMFIGNPPFGKQSSIAKKFIKHITKCPLTTTIGFILSKSFKKESMQKCFPLEYWLIEQIDLPNNAFNIAGKIHNVPCVFQIWQKKAKKRIIEPYPLSKSFNFVKIHEDPDFSLRRVGVYAGKIDSDTEKSIQSHYFIKIKKEIDIQTFRNSYETIKFTHDNTAGPRSISKKEFIIAINQLFL